MCGINGVFSYNLLSPPPDVAELRTSRDAMAFRGPDGAGAWSSPDGRLGFGHRRLAIIDLSEASAQPMVSTDGRYAITFNGEIYNYKALRAELVAAGHVFRSTGDTEVLLALHARHGTAMLARLRGMFALAIWDDQDKVLTLARDPYGIKPLYVSDCDGVLRFASQVKALLAGGAIDRTPEPAGLVGFYLWGSVPEPFTLYRDIRALPPGTAMVVKAGGVPEIRSFASVDGAFEAGARHPAPAGDIGALVRRAMHESVAAHLVADVEVGLFLSSGVDSGALLALMRDAGQARIRAITLAFEEFAGTPEDETPLAIESARHFGAEHTVRMVSEREFHDDRPRLLAAMDQPSIDGVNTWFVAKAAQECGLKVCLSGLGGDEVLAGYPGFREIPRLVTWARRGGASPGIRAFVRRLAGLSGLVRDRPKLAGLLDYGRTYRGAYFLRRGLYLPDEITTLLSPDLVREGLVTLGFDQWVRGGDEVFASPLSHIAALESTRYLRNQLLRDSDWAGMAHSLEIRTPFVDYHLLEALAPVVPHLAHLNKGKALLANAPKTPLADSVLQRAKTGFGVPSQRWFARPGQKRNSMKGLASRQWATTVMQDFTCDPAIEGGSKARAS
jgi:asparagine synthase (glutamine-hydrolysing)